MKSDPKTKTQDQPVRILARQLGRELSDRELDAVSGAHPNYGTKTDEKDRDQYA